MKTLVTLSLVVTMMVCNTNSRPSSQLTRNEEMRSLLQLVSALKDRTLDRRGVAHPMTDRRDAHVSTSTEEKRANANDNNIEADVRVVGGQSGIKPGTTLWRASLRFKREPFHFCGAVLISPEWLVTAAHCVTSNSMLNEMFLQVILGQPEPTSMIGRPTAHKIAKTIQHPGFINHDGVGLPNDIALIKLKMPAVLNEFVAPIDLAPENTDYSHSTCYVPGWDTQYGGSLPNLLQQTRVSSIGNRECKEMWNDKPIADSQICSLNTVSLNKTACYGDSGEPLICEAGDSFELAGTTSWGQLDCSTSHPNVFTRISAYRNWISVLTGL